MAIFAAVNLLEMESITDFFISIIRQCGSLDLAEAEFRRSLVDYPELRRAYREYCREEGVSERRGFLDFAEDYAASENEVWDALSDFDNQE